MGESDIINKEEPFMRNFLIRSIGTCIAFSFLYTVPMPVFADFILPMGLADPAQL
jgi:hypothetical protein